MNSVSFVLLSGIKCDVLPLRKYSVKYVMGTAEYKQIKDAVERHLVAADAQLTFSINYILRLVAFSSIIYQQRI